MVRTIITISEHEKEWLERYSRQHHQSIAETIRSAIIHYRKHNKPASYKEILKRTAGIWKNRKIDSAKYVEKLRKEWE